METTALPDFMALWDYYKPAETEAKFRELLPAAEASGDTSYHAQLVTQLARTQGLQAKFDDAHSLLDEADALIAGAEAEGVDMRMARLRSLLERGRTLNSSGHPADAVPLFTQAYELGLSIGEDNLAIDAVHMVAIAGTPEQQIEWAARGIESARASSDEKAQNWEGPLLNNLGWTYHNLGRYDEALALFKQSFDWRSARGHVKQTRIAKWTVARCLRSLGQLDEALKLQRELEAEFAAAGEPDGYVFEELGECLLAQGDAESAAPYFAQAYELLSRDTWLPRNEPERLARMKELGGVDA